MKISVTTCLAFLSSLGLVACSGDFAAESQGAKFASGPVKQLTLLATNDIHGGVEPSLDFATNEKIGGMAVLAEVVDAIRRGVKARGGELLLLDGGDQFQGTLLSNRDEGKLVLSLMSDIGYTALVPGNHDYDFGPQGWLDDRVTPSTVDQDPRGAFKSLIAANKGSLHFLSANTYKIDSIQDADGQKITVKPEGCRQESKKRQIDWSRAERADFVEPYFIQHFKEWDLRVAMIGLDNPGTPSSTTRENVVDLCFRPIDDTYAEIREQLKGKADVFIIVMHDGDIDKATTSSDELRKFADVEPPLVDAIVAGHTHSYNNALLGKAVPFIQSRSGGRYFGRIDLFWDVKKKALVRSDMKQWAALKLLDGACDAKADFCTVKGGVAVYDGEAVKTNKAVREKIATERRKVDVEAKVVVAKASGPLKSHRTDESALGNTFADELYKLTLKKLPAKLAKEYSTDGEPNLVSFLNAGGLRRPLSAGQVTYEDVFEVLPFNNHGVVVAPVSAERLIKLLQSNAMTCGKFGTLVFSGLKVEYKRDCKRSPEVEKKQIDSHAKLTKVTLVRASGETVLLDEEAGLTSAPDLDVLVSTLDFIAQGGQNFSALSGRGVDVVLDLGVIREALVADWKSLRAPRSWSDKVDGRYLRVGE